MNTLVAGIQALGNVIDSAEDVVQALQAMRDEIPDEQWDQLADSYPALDRLISSCIDLEPSLDQ
jgi:uncharacterized protein Yka (UPF0111/DUF47 family)